MALLSTTSISIKLHAPSEIFRKLLEVGEAEKKTLVHAEFLIDPNGEE
jgi:hypothetical protein